MAAEEKFTPAFEVSLKVGGQKSETIATGTLDLPTEDYDKAAFFKALADVFHGIGDHLEKEITDA